MIKLGGMLVKHKDESLNWKGETGPKIEENVMLHPKRVYGMCNRRVAYVHQGLP